MLPSNLIKEYLHSKFPTNKVFGQEFTTNSIFAEDEKLHMSINMDTGLWQDFKSQEKGNFAQLIAAVEEIPYESALSYLRSKLFDTPELLFEVSSIRLEQEPVTNSNIQDIFNSFKKFDPRAINESNLTERLARKFILSRKLQKGSFYVSTSGRYANRLIIPYMKDEKPYYFQARNLSIVGMKYLNPSRGVTGVKASDILYPFKEDCDYVFITEGPLDAITLQINGINATCTQGSRLSHAQAEMLKTKQIIFAYDNDEAGAEGVRQARRMMLSKNKNEFCIARLPQNLNKTYKDWNELHIDCDSKAQFRDFLVAGLKPVDFEYEITEALN